MAFKRTGGFGDRDNGGSRFKKSFDRPRFGGNNRFAKRPFGKKPGFGGKSNNGEMFPATCASCGKTFELPFLPDQGRSVYCRDCFGGHTKGKAPMSSGGDFKPSFNGRSEKPKNDPALSKMADEIEKLNRKLDALFDLMKQNKTSAEVKKSEPEPEAPKATKKKVVSKKKEVKPKKVVAKKTATKSKK